ncbi:hypothetical protein [Streptomyces sp. RK75]|uniref:hypothetical protein n=1 Tax=Streptomyces sp. RK75 TaxID=2824895 RepID=UPI001B37C559|nr:hypothetical protein [Streptomyces sp. RK75]MBQ0867395.1 hypothetical protein [Streptomyces sp. RK75]
MPVPKDPRTPQQRIAQQLEAAHRKLRGPALSSRERAELSDRIHQLKQQAARIS